MTEKAKSMWMALGLVACGVDGGQVALPAGQSGAGAPRELKGAELSALPADESLVVDLREARPVLVDMKAEPLDLRRVTLICPNGAKMALDDWLLSPEISLGVPLRSTHFGLFPPGATDPVCQPNNGLLSCECNQRCYKCTDGVWVCYDPCVFVGAERLPWRPTDPTLGHDLPSEPPPTNPLPPVPPDPSQGTGSSGGSGGSSGGGGTSGGSGGSSGGSGGGGSGSGGSGESSSGSGSGHSGGGTPAGGGLGGGL